MPLRGTHKLDEFEIVEVIGSGQYGVCKKVKKKSDGKVENNMSNNERARFTLNTRYIDFCMEGTRLRSNDRSGEEVAVSRGQLVEGA